MKGKFNYFWLALIDEGSAILPPSQADILQWGIGTDDGLIVNDKKSPLVVEPEAAYVNRPVLIMDGVGDNIATPLTSAVSCTVGGWFNIDTSAVSETRALWSFGNSVGRLYTSSGVFKVGGSGNTAVNVGDYDNEWHLYSITLDASSNVTSFSIDDIELWTGISAGTPDADNRLKFGSRSASSVDGIFFKGKIGATFGCGRTWTNEETEGLTCYDVSSNDDDATITANTAIATIRAARGDGMESWCALNGFRLSGTLQIPALADGTAAADGNAITNLGGYISNGADVDIQQTDLDFTILGGASFFGDGSTVWDDKTRAQWLAFVSGNTGLWLQWVDEGGVCHLKQWVQYDVTRGYTEAEALQLIRWCNRYTSSCGAGVVEVLRDVGGVAILDGNDKVILVQP